MTKTHPGGVLRLTVRSWANYFRKVLICNVILIGVVGVSSSSSSALPAGNTGGYPWAGAPCQYGGAGGVSCKKGQSKYDWFVDEDKDGGYSGQAENISPYSYNYRNCTDYVAWKLHSLGVPLGKVTGLGNAGEWATKAPEKGIRVDGVPAIGSVAIDARPGYGHVAYVAKVSGNRITVYEYNYNINGEFLTREGTPSQLGFTHFAHFEAFMTRPPAGAPRGGTYADGAYISIINTSKAYVMAGGAPLRVSSWANVGGPKHTTVISQAQFNALPDFPRNGTVIKPGTGNTASIVVGGAALKITSWSRAGGMRPFVVVDQWAIDHQLLDFPVDGTFIKSGTTNTVQVVAGGAALKISNWANVGGVQPYTVVDQWAINHQLRDYPANGTFLKNGAGNGVYQVAGGAALPVSNWANVGGGQPFTVVDPWALNHQLLLYPTDGTVLKNAVGNGVYVVAGGALLPVSDWNNIGGVKPYTDVDLPAAVRHLRRYPLDGTVIKAGTSNTVQIVAGGMALKVTDWANVGGARPYTVVDQWAIDHTLLALPADGTFLRGYMSGRVYQVRSQAVQYVGNPANVTGVPVTVDDWAIRHQLGQTW